MFQIRLTGHCTVLVLVQYNGFDCQSSSAAGPIQERVLFREQENPPIEFGDRMAERNKSVGSLKGS